MRLLITGGAGFIGSHIAEAAIAQGWTTAVLDNLSSGKRENIPPDVTFFQTDICNSTEVHQVFADFRPDFVSHQAAQASVAISVREPQLDAQINILGSIHVLQACVAHGVRRIVFASTGGAIYGEVPDGTRASIHTPPVPVSPYACSKFAVEKYLECYRQEHGLPYTILRYSNVYGPRQDPHGEAGVVAIFCRRILAGDSIRINARREAGDAGCVRDYVYIADVARANMAALEGKVSDPILNVGTGQETTTRLLAETLQSLLNTTVPMLPSERRAGDVERSLLDADRLHQLLGPPTDLRAGLSSTVQWFRSQSAGPPA